MLCIYVFSNILLLLNIPFCILFLKSGIDKSTKWSTIPACPSLTYFFNMGNTEGINSSKMLCSTFVYDFFLYKFVSGLILSSFLFSFFLFFFFENLWFDDLCA